MKIHPEQTLLDDMDRAILRCLQRQGRMTHAELSERVNLSPSACHRRVQRLEAVGVIRDYVALLDARAVGRVATVFVEIRLSGQSEEVLNAFERAVARACLDQDMVSVRHGFAGRRRRQADAEFLWLDFLRAADPHGRSSLSSSAVSMRPFLGDCFDLYRETCE